MAALALGWTAGAASAAGPRPATLVVCAPGSPGTTEEAQGAMDAFASAVATGAGLPSGTLRAAYAASEDAGVARLRDRDAGVALVSLPFFLKHEKALVLREARLQPVPQDRAGTERWSLVARRGRITAPKALEGFTLLSTAGFAPGFVRGPALGAWGPLPAGVKIAPSGAVLSALRRAAAGEPVAVLLDGAQAAALPSLPLAAELEVVARSPALPVGVVAVVDQRLPAARWRGIEAALRRLPSAPDGAAALAGIRMSGFEPLDGAALAAARRAYAEAVR
jgi:hypothetical protein